MKSYLTIVLALLCVTQLHAQAPRIPDAVRYYPDYHQAYADAVECTGTKHPKPYDGITWMLVPRPNFTDPYMSEEEAKLPNIGEWVRPDTIFVAKAYANSWVPKHEMIHYLRQNIEHPMVGSRKVLFGEACHATWGYLPADTTRIGPGTTIHGPAYPLP